MKTKRITRQGEIIIAAPTLEVKDGKARLLCEIDCKGRRETVWFSVEEKYGQYLCWERSDAFVMGLLSYAMREGCDVRCEAPMTARLHYQITETRLPLLAKISRVLYHPTVIAPLEATEMPNAKGVGTGVSCGVDSLATIKRTLKMPYEGMALTHLVLNNVGSFKLDRLEQYDWHVKHAKAFAAKLGMELIVTNSNFATAFPQNHLLTATYSAAFAIYALQKLWHVYYFSSGGDDILDCLKFADNEQHSSEDYNLVILDTFSTGALKIYSESAAILRQEKLQSIIDWDLAQKYLHVCTEDHGPNCNHCPKCLRTLTGLDALGALDKFKAVFDIEDYKAHLFARRRWLYAQQVFSPGDPMTRPAYHLLKSKISLLTRLAAILWENKKMRKLRRHFEKRRLRKQRPRPTPPTAEE